MVRQREKRATKLTAIILSLMMAVVFMPAFAFASNGDGGITVYMTVSENGGLVRANDGHRMAQKEVTVVDLDGDGHFTFDEALKAAHEEYNSADGYNTINDSVYKVWGQGSPAGFSLIRNGSVAGSVKSTEVAEGDYLVVSINKNDSNGADYYTEFTERTKKVAVGEECTLTAQGFFAKDPGEPDAVEGLIVDIYYDEMDWEPGKKTDENGKVTIEFKDPGTYAVTLYGTLKRAKNVDWLTELGRDSSGRAFYGSDSYEYDREFAYTEDDYGNGPYPIGDINWEYYDESFDLDNFDMGHLLYSNEVICSCQIIVPVCIVTVVDPQEDPGYLADLAKKKQEAIDELAKADFSGLGAEDQLNAIMANIAAIAKVNAATTNVELDAAVADAQATQKAVTTRITSFSAKKGKKKATVKWAKDPDNTFDGYQISYKKAKAKAAAFVEITDPETTSAVINKLSKKKKYTFKVRGYKTIDGQTVYGAWSAAKTIKIK